MFNFIKKLIKPDSPSETPPFLSVESYQEFPQRFVDRPDIYPLMNLKIGPHDLGPEARFLEPLIHPRMNKAFTWQLKWVPFNLGHLLAGTGWNQRSICFDLEHGTFKAGPWKELTREAMKLIPEWDMPGRALPLNSFQTPSRNRTPSSEILAVTDHSLAIKEWDKTYEFPWNEIEKIHFSKRSLNTMETPFYEVEVKHKEFNYRLELPKSRCHPFYQKLIRNGLLTSEALVAFLDSEGETELTVISALGNLILPVDKSFDIEAAEKGIACEGNFFPWSNLYQEGVETFTSVDLGGIFIGKMKVTNDNENHPHLPVRKFYFNFSSVNGKTVREEIMNQFSLWLKHNRQYPFEFNPSFSQFLYFHCPLFEMRLYYDDSEGSGYCDLDGEFYRRVLLSKKEYQTSFSPVEALEIKESGISLQRVSDFETSNILPAPDELHKTHLTFWKGQNGRTGLTLNGFLYLWENEQFKSVENEVLDDWGERGGPYYETVLTCSHSSLRLSTPGVLDLQNLRKFLEQP